MAFFFANLLLIIGNIAPISSRARSTASAAPSE